MLLSSPLFILFQNKTVQHKLAEIKTQICVGRAFMDNCLQLHADKRLDSATASMAKYWYVLTVTWECHWHGLNSDGVGSKNQSYIENQGCLTRSISK